MLRLGLCKAIHFLMIGVFFNRDQNKLQQLVLQPEQKGTE